MAGASADNDGVRGLASLSTIGLTTARMLADAGVPDSKTLRKIGAAQAYRRLRFHFGKRASASYLYALECALSGCDWRELRDTRMSELKEQAHKIAAELDAMRKR
jgi:DNA transformation protein